jgi:hypothetical protein
MRVLATVLMVVGSCLVCGHCYQQQPAPGQHPRTCAATLPAAGADAASAAAVDSRRLAAVQCHAPAELLLLLLLLLLL